MSRSRYYSFIALSMMTFCVSCEKETQNVVILERSEVADPSYYEPGTMLVDFDERVVESLEKQVPTKAGFFTKTGISSVDKAFSSLAVYSLERVFPDAGEWEERHREAGLHKFYYVKYDESKTVGTKAGNAFSSIDGVNSAEMVRKIKPLAETPYFNDPYLSRQWHYINPGTGGLYKNGADINVLPVWKEYTTGSSDVIVNVVDGGVDLTHEDLKGVVIEGGRNGSWNFVDGSSTIVAHDHGTHVAGTIAAINNNGKGVCGIAGGEDGKGGVKILSSQIFRYNSNTGKDEGGDSASAIVWGADHGAVISQNSWGYEFKTEKDALNSTIDAATKSAVDYFIRYAGTDKSGNQTGPMKGGVVIFAAGNDNWSIGWPAAYDKIIAVGSSSSMGTKSYYSNYGSWVDIAAPGGDANLGPVVVSTVPGGYAGMQGTSMACPHVSGVAALLVSYYGGPGFTNDMLKERLLSGANPDFLPSGSDIGPMLDAYGAFSYGSANPPEKVESYTVEGRGGSVAFDWTVGADESGKPAHGYLLLASEKASDFEGLNLRKLPSTMKSSTVLVGNLKKGDKISGYLDYLDFETTYYVAIAGYDYGKAFSELSEVKKVTTTANNAPEIDVVTELPWNVPASRTFTAKIHIYDPDNHEINVIFKADSRLKSVNSTTNDDGYYYLTVNGLQEEPGTYSVKYNVSDIFGMETIKTFDITVLENRAPVAKKEFDNMVFEKSGQSVTLRVSDYFEDPDGDVLSFEVTHTNPKVAHLNPLGDEFTLTTLGFGIDEITVKALDARKAETALTFKVSVRDPKAGADIYPSQVKDYLTVGGGAEAETSIKIVSSTGAVVYESVEMTSIFEPAKVDMRNFAPGVYTVTVTVNGVETTRTIVKL